MSLVLVSKTNRKCLKMDKTKLSSEKAYMHISESKG